MKKQTKLLSLFIALLISSVIFAQQNCTPDGGKEPNSTSRSDVLRKSKDTIALSKKAFVIQQQQEEILAKSDSLIVLLEKKVAEKEAK